MSTRTPKADATEPAEDATPEPDAPDTETTPVEGDNLGDDSLADLARPYLDDNDPGDIEVHHGPPPADVADYSDSCPHGAKPGEPCDECGAEQEGVDDRPLDMPNMRFGQSVFAELARESAGLYGDWPDLPEMPTGIALGFDEARAENLDGFVADKTTLADWMRAARANTYGSGIAA